MPSIGIFYYLNRWRGTWAWFAKVEATFFGLIFGLATQDYYIGISMATLFLGGESMGWGEWVGGMIRKIKWLPDRNTSRENPIYRIGKIATRFSEIDTLDYHATALFIRGIYWWLPALFPLFWALDAPIVILAIFTLAMGFPMSLVFATADNEHWKNAEHSYGHIQDFVFGCLLILIIFN